MLNLPTLNNRLRLVVNITPWALHPGLGAPVPLHRGLDGLRSLSDCFSRGENSCF